MKIRINRDERWPDYYLEEHEDFGREVEVPDGFDKKFRRVKKQYNELTEVLTKAWQEAGPVVHATPPDGLLTPCCGRRTRDCESQLFSSGSAVTCKGA